jgi:hypothetical protein
MAKAIEQIVETYVRYNTHSSFWRPKLACQPADVPRDGDLNRAGVVRLRANAAHQCLSEEFLNHMNHL